jgi:hypothetical protein
VSGTTLAPGFFRDHSARILSSFRDFHTASTAPVRLHGGCARSQSVG